MRHLLPIALIAAASLAGQARATGGPPGMSWGYFETKREGAKLAYGVPETDDLAVMMMCHLGSGRISIRISVGDLVGPAAITLRSGDAWTRLRASLEPDEGEGGDLKAMTTSRDPALTAFAATGDLAVEAGGRRFGAPAPDPTPVRTFLKRCAG